ncbi:MAG: hydroxymethylglutaryl-CoA reductase, degradative [Bdellovibrionales bacterium]|nr:hydroxymethylglutaryl-CoA reductase, degradative [Bdellovibrionales bacterium]
MSRFVKLLENFHRLPFEERQERLAQWCDLDPQELQILRGVNALPIESAEHFIENVIGVFPLPLGVATYFEIDGRDVIIPMAVEETSIVAAVSSTAKWIRKLGGKITTESRGRLIIGQIQIPRVERPDATVKILNQHKLELVVEANQVIPGLIARGGGVRDLEFRLLPREDATGRMLVIHVMCDPCDAMGANLINQVCEALKPLVEELTDEKVGLCILSNLVDGRLAYARVELPIDEETGRGIEEATQFAKTDPYRATTHNKGVLNGIDPILIATGNDWRAVEAGIHAYTSRTGKYQPVTDWKYGNGKLVGEFLAPLAVGTVGGVTMLHPTARLSLKIMGITKAEELARICAAMGLVQNLGALKALATVGIVKGHMKLHASNLALAAGATDDELPRLKAELTEALAREKRINLSRAKEILEQLRTH